MNNNFRNGFEKVAVSSRRIADTIGGKGLLGKLKAKRIRKQMMKDYRAARANTVHHVGKGDIPVSRRNALWEAKTRALGKAQAKRGKFHSYDYKPKKDENFGTIFHGYMG